MSHPAKFTSAEDQYGALLNLLCAPSISTYFELPGHQLTNEDPGSACTLNISLNLPNVELKDVDDYFDLYLVTKASLGVAQMGATASTNPGMYAGKLIEKDFLLAHKIDATYTPIFDAQSKAKVQLCYELSQEMRENAFCEAIIRFAAIAQQKLKPYQTDSLNQAIADIVDAIHSENSNLISTNELFSLYVAGRISGQNFSLPNQLLTQAADLEGEASNQSPWDAMIMDAQHHEYVKSILPLKIFGKLSSAAVTANVQSYCKSQCYNVDSFIVNDNLQMSNTDGLQSWLETTKS